ncbi:MAG: hypothetical protein ISS33_06500 [Candidatus Omnitrophica bacterium]|nr:hypothetical protein [Candidatus Omnitrophota bacterium]
MKKDRFEKHIISRELKRHAPFTFLGALTGIAIMVFLHSMPYREAYNVFYVLHPMHVFLSALVTASMYRNYKECGKSGKCGVVGLLAVGFFGSIGIATLSDSIMPYLGEILLKMPRAEPHIGFIEEWYIIVPLALAGIVLAYFRPSTKFPHAGHVLISTWASLFHIIMAGGKMMTPLYSVVIFIFLFLAVWVPCCISDIVFPLVFVGKRFREK